MTREELKSWSLLQSQDQGKTAEIARAVLYEMQMLDELYEAASGESICSSADDLCANLKREIEHLNKVRNKIKAARGK